MTRPTFTGAEAARVLRLREVIERFFDLEGVADAERRIVELHAAVRVLERDEGITNYGAARRRVDISVRAAALADKVREVA